MIKIENLVTPSPEWWDVAIKGMRNSYKSSEKSDTQLEYEWYGGLITDTNLVLGKEDKQLLLKLAKAGTSHRKVLRQLPVIMDITAPLYFWKQLDQYKLGTVTNSESTMNTIMKDEFHEGDFSFNNLYPEEEHEIVQDFNNIRTRYLKAVQEGILSGAERAWGQLNELLPQSYNQKRTWSANYEVLVNIIQQRREHKLKEWNDFINFLLDNVPYLREIVEAINE